MADSSQNSIAYVNFILAKKCICIWTKNRKSIAILVKPNISYSRQNQIWIFFIIHEIQTQKVIRMTLKLFKRIYKWSWKSDDQKGYIIDGLLPDSLNCIVFISNREIITCPKPIVLKYVKYHATFLKHISEFYFSCSFCHPREKFCENLYIWPFLTTINVGTLDAINFDTLMTVLNVELEVGYPLHSKTSDTNCISRLHFLLAAKLYTSIFNDINFRDCACLKAVIF